MIRLDLLADKPILLDGATPTLGGAFWNPGIPCVYDPIPLRWVFDQLSAHEQPTLLDIGASTGCFALLAAHHRGLQVYAFEPAQGSRELLTKNVRLNGLTKQVHILDAAVADFEGTGSFHVIDPPSQIGLSLLNGAPTHYKAYHDVPVPVVTLDAFCARGNIAPTVVKIDTEGGEWAVLQGAVTLLRKHKPAVVCEYDVNNAAQYGYHPDDLISFLSELGYTVTRLNTDLYAEAK